MVHFKLNIKACLPPNVVINDVTISPMHNHAYSANVRQPHVKI
jgi:hypothetical protein